MIAVERRGRLGNQLFQYAFAVAAAARLGTSFALPGHELGRLFRLGDHRLGALRLRLENRLRPYPVVDQDDFPTPEALLAGLADHRLYTGYFQSERYFGGHEDEVRRAFAFRREHEQRLRERFPDLDGRPYVCCHVRRTDYHSWHDGIVLPASYYREALTLLAPEPGTPVVFVGDDLEDLPRELGDLPGARFERNDEALDLLLLSRAASVVTSNSSFGWWGAWLGGAGRRVVAPRHWLGFKRGTELPPWIIPDGWERLPVT